MTERRDKPAPETIDNPHSGRVKKVQALSRRSVREKTGLIAVEGPQAVRELLRHAPAHVVDVYCQAELFWGPAVSGEYAELLSLAAEVTPHVHPVTAQVARALGPSAQGIVAVALAEALPTRIDLAGPGPGLLLVLPATQDPGNAGTLVRLADAAGARAVLTGADTARVDSPKVLRFSAGSAFHIPTVPFSSLGVPSTSAEAAAPNPADLQTVAKILRQNGWQIWGTAGSGAVELGGPAASAAQFAGQKIAWVMGNEARGLTRNEQNACDQLVRIRMYGQAESLNVTHAATLCLFAAANAQHETEAYAVSGTATSATKNE